MKRFGDRRENPAVGNVWLGRRFTAEEHGDPDALGPKLAEARHNREAREHERPSRLSAFGEVEEEERMENPVRRGTFYYVKGELSDGTFIETSAHGKKLDAFLAELAANPNVVGYSIGPTGSRGYKTYARNEAGGFTETLAPIPETALRHIGFCPVCTGRIKVRGDKLVHHGYKRPGFGYIVGDCYGVHKKPHELSDECAKGYLRDVVEGEIAVAEARVAYLGDPPYDPPALLFPYKESLADLESRNAERLKEKPYAYADDSPQWVRDGFGQPILRKRSLADLIALRLVEPLLYQREPGSGADWTRRVEALAREEWDRTLKHERREAASTLTSWRAEEARLSNLIATWELRPLQSVEEERLGISQAKIERATKRDAEIQAKMDEALAKVQARIDSAVKNRNAHAVFSLFYDGYRLYKELTYRKGPVLSREAILKLIDRDNVWRAFNLLTDKGYSEERDRHDADAPWSTSRRVGGERVQTPPDPWPASLGGGKVKVPA